MTEFNFLTHRRFLWTAGAAAEAITLKSCAINPPSPSNLSPKALSPTEMPETNRIELGYIAIAESAPLMSAGEKGLFARHGISANDGQWQMVKAACLISTRATICGSSLKVCV